MDVIILSILTGASVVLITILADKFGHRIGGLIATTPVTATFGMVYVLKKSDTRLIKNAILAGNYSIIAFFMAVVGYFFIIKLNEKMSNTAKVIMAELVFFIIYIGGVFLLRCYLPVGWYLFAVDVFLLLILYFTFMRVQIKLTRSPKKNKGYSKELVIRFVSGFMVFVAISFLAKLETVLSGAFAVFPGIFATSIGLIGIRQSAEFSAKAIQAGVLGSTAIVFFILGYSLWIPLLSERGNFSITFATMTALMLYFLSLIAFGKMGSVGRD
jgi:uncharacterized membrane protein (GlpM family)